MTIQARHDDMNLADLIGDIWRAKFYMIVMVALCAVMAFLFLKISTPHYRASMIVAPADGYALGDYASMIDNERIAAMPFWRPMDQEGVSTDFYRFIRTIRGPSVGEILLTDRGVLSGIQHDEGRALKTKEELAIYLSKKIQIDPIGATPLRRIHYAHPDPEFAAAMLRKIHLVADQMIRRDRKRQSQSRIDYLKDSLSKNQNPDHRKGITNLLMQQEHIQMLANLNEAYAAIVVEPAFTAPKPDWPKPFVVWPVALFLGGFLGYIIFSIRRSFKA